MKNFAITAKAASVTGTIPTFLSIVPVHNATEVGADGGNCVNFPGFIPVRRHFLTVEGNDFSLSHGDLIQRMTL